MANEKFYLIFSEQPQKKIYINEPIGYGDVDFNLNQKENGHGRDITLNGGENQFRFTDQRHEEILTMIFYYNDFYGFEADVKLSIVLEDAFDKLLIQLIIFPPYKVNKVTPTLNAVCQLKILPASSLKSDFVG